MDLFYHQTLTSLHRIRVSGQPEYLASQFYTNRERADRVRSTRQDHLLSLPHITGSAAGKRQYVYRAAKLYNELPPELYTASVATFKRKLKQRLLPTHV